MVITCDSCGSERFRAGELELDLDGGYTVVMPCAECGTPSKKISSNDAEFAKLLMEFFGGAAEVGDTFAHKLRSVMTLQPEPDWLKKRVDQRLEWMVKGGAIETAQKAGAPFIMTFLDEGDPNMTEAEQKRWERSCDNCGRYIPEDAPEGPDGFYTGHVSRTVDSFQILMAFGTCGTCKAVTTMKGTEDD